MATILIVDDLPDNILLVKNFFINEPYRFVDAGNGIEALKLINEEKPDLILLDIVMPGMDGFQLCEKIKSNPETCLIPVIMLTGLDDSESKLKGIELGADDFVTKPFNAIELRARVASLLRMKEYTDQLEYAEKIIFSLALVVEAKDPYTQGHCQRLADYGSRLGKKIGLEEKEIRTIRRGGILHDIGKLAIHDDILLKPGPLSKEEYEIIKSHPIEGEKICKPLKTLADVLPIIRHHQERSDGLGYPDGLKNDEIPLAAKIIAIVDCYDALTTDRPYRRAVSREEAIAIIEEEKNRGKWDEKLFSEFCKVVYENPKSFDIHNSISNIKVFN
ncbi:MAG: response regulator [Calditrichaceae bacterium]|nr:response regulator [Calditrichaceae bacterium]MBN2708856.1 response regulator [Calditrichaceae bacterium]RQV97617.1 MAG: response regulator [Calditrichota bacterium]